MKTAAIFINIGDPPYSELSLKANTKYYNHFGIEVRQIKERPLSLRSNDKFKWCAYKVHEIFDDLDFFIIQDLDIIPCNMRFNLLDFIDFHFFNMAVDSTRYGKHIEDSPFPHFKYNAGLMAFHRSYDDILDQIYDYGKDDPEKYMTCDQYYTNLYLWNSRIFVNEIPQLFNTFFYPKMDYTKTVFCHYTNTVPSREKLKFIEKYHPKEMFI